MNPDLQTLKEIFHSARELRPNERKAFLDETCGTDEQLRREIEQLLESDRQSDDFIAEPPAQIAAELFGETQKGSDCGRVVGQYRLIECVGAGGMGAVYLAERADHQFEMQVAVKLIKRGMDTDAVLRRFQHERQILASLEHPNIARLLDGGTTDDGVPYFVMEYIKGERIDRYTEARQLSVTDRLELFRQVCGAVSYAHQHLVVHRDLKPSNILVTSDGTPKLLDFGIAKIVEPNDSGEAFATITLPGAMTPEYASPEQIEGAPATTLSDVYSLGAVLYQLLSTRPPYELPNRSPQAVAKAMETAQIAKPSAVANRAEDARRLRGDLDNIVLMAMRRDSARRYRSVEQFSDDIRRHLEGRPVIARRDTLSYRTGKFLHRNKIGVAAAALLLLTLVGGIVATAWQAQRAKVGEIQAKAAQARAERRFNDVRRLANTVLFDYHDAIKALPGATKVRERLVKDALSYLDSLAEEAQADPALQRELAAAYEKVGEVRGGPSGGNLGDVPGAVESHRKALRIREMLAQANPRDVQARRDLASSYHKVGFLAEAYGSGDGGRDDLWKARKLFLELVQEQPEDDTLQLELAETCLALWPRITDFAGSLEQARAALAICDKLVAKNPGDQRYRRKLASADAAVAYVLSDHGDLAGAMEAQNKALALRQALLAEDPINADYRAALVVTYQRLGDLCEDGDKPAALEHFRRAEKLDEELVAADPANADTGQDLAYTQKRIADLQVEMEDNSEALVNFSKAAEGYEKVVGGAPAHLTSRFLVATCRAGIARMHARLGNVTPALEECGKAINLLKEITGDEKGHLGRAQAYAYLGHAYAAIAASQKSSGGESRQHIAAARDMFQEALNIIDDARRQNALGGNEDWAKEIAAEMAKCNAALQK